MSGPPPLVAGVPLAEVEWALAEIAFRRRVFERIQDLQAAFPPDRLAALRATAAAEPRRVHGVVAPQIAGLMPPTVAEAGHRAALRLLGVLNQMRDASRTIGQHLDPAADEVRLFDLILHIQESYPPEVRAQMATGAREPKVLTAAVASIWASSVHPDTVFVLRAQHTPVELGLARLVQRDVVLPGRGRGAEVWHRRLDGVEDLQVTHEAVIDDLVDHVRRLYDVLVRVGVVAADGTDPYLEAVGQLLVGLSSDGDVAPGYTTSRDLLAALDAVDGPRPEPDADESDADESDADDPDADEPDAGIGPAPEAAAPGPTAVDEPSRGAPPRDAPA